MILEVDNGEVQFQMVSHKILIQNQSKDVVGVRSED